MLATPVDGTIQAIAKQSMIKNQIKKVLKDVEFSVKNVIAMDELG